MIIMTRIVVITHGNLANELVAIAESIIDRKTEVVPVCFDLQMDYSVIKNYIEKALAN